MKRTGFLVLLLCLVASISQSETKPQPKLKSYQSQKFGFIVSVPETWKIDPDEANAYYALYSPEAFTGAHNRLDLTSGIKIEILPHSNEELENFFSRNDLQPIPNTPNQYYFRDADYYYLFTVIKGSPWNFVIIGYFPEKKKEAEYLPLYQQVIKSFTLI
ncbi:MAG: hypothetical protein NTZ49_01175 [Candidatus Parcubacteria bacterium]|nr:hypothetical protein [Candidatus Parcubacteria bacterium]